MTEPKKPGALPEWASTEIKDAVSGQLNVYEPPEQKKKLGWNYKEKPARQWLNWLHKTTYEWLKYFDYFLNRPKIYTTGYLPDAATSKSQMIYISNTNTLAYSDGTNWIKIKTDGNV